MQDFAWVIDSAVFVIDSMKVNDYGLALYRGRLWRVLQPRSLVLWTVCPLNPDLVTRIISFLDNKPQAIHGLFWLNHPVLHILHCNIQATHLRPLTGGVSKFFHVLGSLALARESWVARDVQYASHLEHWVRYRD